MSPNFPALVRRWPIGLAVACLALVGVATWQWQRAAQAAPPPASDFDGARAYGHLESLCALGPRPTDSPGMKAQQKLLEEHFQKLGGVVSRQSFKTRHPQTGAPVRVTNLIVHWHPRAKEHVLLAAHYDTRPFPDRDRRDPKGKFVGANDGASGVAVLMELAQHLKSLTSVGVDFVLFDAEEFVFGETGTYFMGSEYFAYQYAQSKPRRRYRAAVLLDMVADKHLELHYEGNTLSWPESRPLAESIWQSAQQLGVREFVPQVRHAVRDDHLALREIAGIPACDIIDFDYPHWHTREDTPDKCSADSLAKVGAVMLAWLRAGGK